MLPRRMVTGAVYLAGWVALAWWGGWLLTATVAVGSLTALYELRKVTGRRRVRLSLEVGYPVCVAFVYAAHCFANDPEAYGLAVVALLVLLVLVDFALHLRCGLRTPTADVSLTVFGCVYCGLMMSAIVLLRGYQPELTAQTRFGPDWEMGKRLLFYLLAVTMVADVGAFVSGRALGRRKLTGTVSPNKTLEGCVGGVLAAVVASLVAGQLFNVGVLPTGVLGIEEAARISVSHRVVLGLLLGVFGQIGDFGASIFKREAEVKDYGSLFPGHGGVIDRLDTLIVNAPLLYLYVQLAL